MKKIIKIAGAGLSGLTAALNLKKAGFEVEVYEANKDVGAAKNGDWQGFENWTESMDVIERLKNCGLEINFDYHPFYNFTFYSSDLEKFDYKCKKPIFYLVRRGNKKGYLDYSLKEQAEKSGIKINYESPLKSEEADIIASGGLKPFAVGLGINFETDLEQEGMGILDDKLAPKGYAYFLVAKGKGTLVTAMFSSFQKKAPEYFKKTLLTFKKLKKFSINNEKKFSGVIHRGLKQKSDKIYIGEAGSFMDYFLGFGMYQTIKSGYLAAQAIIEGKSFDGLVEKELTFLIKNSKLNRFVFEKLGNKGYKLLLKQLTKKADFCYFLHKGYTHNIKKIEALKILKKYYV